MLGIPLVGHGVLSVLLCTLQGAWGGSTQLLPSRLEGSWVRCPASTHHPVGRKLPVVAAFTHCSAREPGRSAQPLGGCSCSAAPRRRLQTDRDKLPSPLCSPLTHAGSLLSRANLEGRSFAVFPSYLIPDLGTPFSLSLLLHSQTQKGNRVASSSWLQSASFPSSPAARVSQSQREKKGRKL